MVAGRALLRLDPPSARKALWSMNLPKILPRFHLRKLERSPLSLGAGSFVLRGLGNHASTLKSQTDRVDPFLYAWHIFFFCFLWHIFIFKPSGKANVRGLGSNRES
jgi:hypothetical protein